MHYEERNQPDAVEGIEGIIELLLLRVMFYGHKAGKGEVKPGNYAQREEAKSWNTFVQIQHHTWIRILQHVCANGKNNKI